MITPGVKSYDFHLEPICLKFLNKNLSLNIALEPTLSLNLINFSFIHKLFYMLTIFYNFGKSFVYILFLK